MLISRRPLASRDCAQFGKDEHGQQHLETQNKREEENEYRFYLIRRKKGVYLTCKVKVRATRPKTKPTISLTSRKSSQVMVNGIYADLCHGNGAMETLKATIGQFARSLLPLNRLLVSYVPFRVFPYH